MKHLFAKLGFRKMDEMERSIALRAQAYSFRFVAAALFVWALYESWVVVPNGGRLDLKPSLLLLTAGLVQVGVQQWLSRRAVAGDEEYREPSLLAAALPVLFWTLLILAVGTSFLLGRR